MRGSIQGRARGKRTLRIRRLHSCRVGALAIRTKQELPCIEPVPPICAACAGSAPLVPRPPAVLRPSAIRRGLLARIPSQLRWDGISRLAHARLSLWPIPCL